MWSQANQGSINIAGRKPVVDPFYRYKMPPVTCSYEKTWAVISNLGEISKALRRVDAEILKFWGCELGTQTRRRHGRAMVKGRHSPATLQETLSLYIDSFLLCRTCERPETDYELSKKELVQFCKGCGGRAPADMEHKVAKFIFNSYKAKKENETKIQSDNGKGKAKKKTKDKKRKEEVKGSKFASILELDDAGALLEAVEEVRKFLEIHPHEPANKLLRVVIREQKMSVLMVKERMRIMVRAGLLRQEDGKEGLLDERYAAVLRSLTEESAMMMSFMQGYLIASLEEAYVLGRWSKARFVLVLKALYNEDVVGEDCILGWAAGDQESDRLVDKSERALLVATARPFLVWLREAGVEDSSDEEEGAR